MGGENEAQPQQDGGGEARKLNSTLGVGEKVTKDMIFVSVNKYSLP